MHKFNIIIPSITTDLRLLRCLDGVQKLNYKNDMLALIVRGKYRVKKGVTFFTPKESIQQFGYMRHKKSHIINPHLHKKRKTRIMYTSEVILLLMGFFLSQNTR